jgi:hypothetical protein
VSAPCFVYRKVAGRIAYERVHDARTLERRIKQGWTTSRDGVAPKPPEPVADPAPTADAEDVAPTREELEAKAAELGLKVDGRWSDKRLMVELTKALEGGE